MVRRLWERLYDRYRSWTAQRTLQNGWLAPKRHPTIHAHHDRWRHFPRHRRHSFNRSTADNHSATRERGPGRPDARRRLCVANPTPSGARCSAPGRLEGTDSLSQQPHLDRAGRLLIRWGNFEYIWTRDPVCIRCISRFRQLAQLTTSQWGRNLRWCELYFSQHRRGQSDLRLRAKRQSLCERLR